MMSTAMVVCESERGRSGSSEWYSDGGVAVVTATVWSSFCSHPAACKYILC